MTWPPSGRALGVDQAATRRDLRECGQDIRRLDWSVALQQGPGDGAGAASEHRGETGSAQGVADPLQAEGRPGPGTDGDRKGGVVQILAMRDDRVLVDGAVHLARVEHRVEVLELERRLGCRRVAVRARGLGIRADGERHALGQGGQARTVPPVQTQAGAQ